MDTANKQSKGTLRRSPRRPWGPFAPAPDPVADARAALRRGVTPGTVVRRFLPPTIRRRRLADLRRLLEQWGAADAFEAELDAELRARDEAA